MVQIQRTEYSGPIPRADELAKYEAILPGAVERIIAMAEIQQKHIHSMETDNSARASELVKTERHKVWFGAGASWSVSIGAMGVALACVIYGQAKYAAAIAAGVVSLLGGLTWAARRQKSS